MCGPAAGLVFDLVKESAFSFKCQACCACCYNKAIRVGPYEALRLSRSIGLSTTEFYRKCTEPGSAILRNKPDGSCLFLTSRECGVYSSRPLVCRLFPLGQIIGLGGKEKYGSMPLHPDCLGFLGEDGTVESYLHSQETGPYFLFEGHYTRIQQRILKGTPRPEKQVKSKKPGDREPSPPDSDDQLSPWLDIDATVESYCRRRGLPKPETLERLAALHFKTMEEWLAQAQD